LARSLVASTDFRDPALEIIRDVLMPSLGSVAADGAEMLRCDPDVVRGVIRRAVPVEAEKLLDHWIAARRCASAPAASSRAP